MLIIEDKYLNNIKTSRKRRETLKKKRWNSFLLNYGLFTLITVISLVVLYLITKNIPSVNVWPVIISLAIVFELYYLLSDLRVVIKKGNYNKNIAVKSINKINGLTL